MDISWYGLNCFRLTERRMASFVTDPYAGIFGYPPLKLKADVVTVSQDGPHYNGVGGVRDCKRVLNGPGEYEIGSVFVIAAPLFNRRKKQEESTRNVAYLLDFDSVTVLHLGALNYIPSQSSIEQFGAVDIALVPVGRPDLDAGAAAEIVSLLEPSIVIPMYYKTPYMNVDLAPVDKFLKEMGVTTPQEEETFRVTKSSLPEQTQVVLLTNRQEE